MNIKLTIAVIWDTSAIMSDSADPIADVIEDSLYSYTHFVPHEVKFELNSHFQNPEKHEAARRGRRFIAERLMRNTAYEEISLAAIAETQDTDSLLGPDSPTDKKLLAVALTMASSHNFNVVSVATQDGGILYEIERRRRAQSSLRISLFGLASPTGLGHIQAACSKNA